MLVIYKSLVLECVIGDSLPENFICWTPRIHAVFIFHMHSMYDIVHMRLHDLGMYGSAHVLI